MKLQARKIEVKTTMILDQKELEMLNYLSKFGQNAASIIYNNIGRVYEVTDWMWLLSSLEEQSKAVIADIEKAQHILIK